MFFEFTAQTSSLLFFWVQSLIFAILLLKKGVENQDQASKCLSLFILLACLYYTPWMCGYSGWYAKDGFRDFLFFVPFQQFFLIGPVIYFYTLFLLQPDFRLSRRDYLHFLPATLYLLYSLIVFVTDFLILDEYYFYADGRDKDLSPWYQISGLASMIIYVVLSIRTYRQYRRRIVEELSYADAVRYNWMQKYLIALLVILSLRIGFFIAYPNYGAFGPKFWYYFFFAALAYYIAFEAYAHGLKSGIAPFFSTLASQNDRSVLAESPPKEVKAPLAGEAFSAGKKQILALMESEKMYQNPTLSLNDVAQTLNITSKQVSQIINQGFEMNFNDFVNHYRVNAFKEHIARGEHEKFTLLSIALSCGFNSKTTFNRVFKRNTGITPLQFVGSTASAPRKRPKS
ncbi:MAG: helix-turn-helix domain-containing protein [Bacteroidia bacterium]